MNRQGCYHCSGYSILLGIPHRFSTKRLHDTMHVFVCTKTKRNNRVFTVTVKYCLARAFTESVTITRNPIITDKRNRAYLEK